MSTVPKRRLTPQEYLALERAAEYRSEYLDGEMFALLNRRVLVEVLSPSTERYDRGAKLAHYQQIPSLQEYILVAQDQPLVERHVRQPDGAWEKRTFDEPAQVFKFASIPARIPLAEIYRGVEFSETPA